MNIKSELHYWLALSQIDGLKVKHIQILRKHFGSFHELFSSKKTSLASLNIPQKLINGIENPGWQDVENDMNWLNKSSQNHIITFDDATYPTLLREIYCPPPILFVRGNIDILNYPQLAMVGSRNPSHIGLETSFAFAHSFASYGFVVTSGLAIGIDGACHSGALHAKGKTLAVMGTGIDVIYPLRHIDLANEIIEKSGALISEFPIGTSANSRNFPIRNRIISGLSLGTLVLEANLYSGSLITAKYAMEQGREVFAIPGSIHNPLSRGCHSILRQGAKLVEKAEDVFEELKLLVNFPKPVDETIFSNREGNSDKGVNVDNELDSTCRKLLECTCYETTSQDTLIERSGLPASVVSSVLTILELQGLVLAVPGGYVKGISKNF